MALIQYPWFCFLTFQRERSPEAIIEFADRFYQDLTRHYPAVNKPYPITSKKPPILLPEWRNSFVNRTGLKFFLESADFHQEWSIEIKHRDEWYYLEGGIKNESLWVIPPRPGQEFISKELLYDLIKSDIADVAFVTVKQQAYEYGNFHWMGKTSRLYLYFKLDSLEKLIHAKLTSKPQTFTSSSFCRFLNFLDQIFPDSYSVIQTILGTNEASKEFLYKYDAKLLAQVSTEELTTQLSFLQLTAADWLEEGQNSDKDLPK